MRILLVADFYAPYVGGVEQHVRTLAHALARQGHSVAVATQATPETKGAAHVDGPVRVHRIRGTVGRVGRVFARASRPWAPPFPDPGLALGLLRVVRRERPDVIHAHDWMGRSSWPASILFRAPLVLSLHYYSHACAKKTRQWDDGPCPGPSLERCIPCATAHYGKAKGVAIYAANRVGAGVDDRLASQFVAVSRATADGNCLRATRSFTVIPNMVPDEAVGETSPVTLPSTPFILYVGDLRPEKGILVLVEAYRRLASAPPLVLVGEGIPGCDVPETEGVIKLGSLPNRTVRDLWTRALFGVIPSVWAEPFGIVALEAMAAGRPVVASRTGGLAEVISDGREGLLVDPGDVEGLASAMRSLVDDEEQRERMAVNAGAAAGNYTSDHCTAELVRVYRSAVRRARRTRRPVKPAPA